MKKVSSLKIYSFLFMLLSGHVSTGQDIGTWSLSGSEIIPSNNEEDELASSYWKHCKDIIPVESFYKYLSGISLTTDGIDNDLAAVNPQDDSNNNWILEIDTADMDLKSLDSLHRLNYIHTLIHEYAHLLTLNGSQVEPTEDIFQDNSKGYLTEEGYAKPLSYLQFYINEFWDGYLLEEWDKADKSRFGFCRKIRLKRFYNRNNEQFISIYAGESPEEDIAESFAFFVLSDHKNAPKELIEKVRFFYQYEELMEIRKIIRSNLPFFPENYLITHDRD